MKTLAHVFTIFSIFLFFYPLHVHGMDKEQTETDVLFSLTQFPKEILNCIVDSSFDFQTKPATIIEANAKFFLKLSILCKKFNQLLTPETIGNLLKNYDQAHRDKALGQIRSGIYGMYRRIRPLLLTLLYAGANPQDGCLLEAAVFMNDVQCTQLLLEHGVDPMTPIEKWGLLCINDSRDARQSLYGHPIFFGAKTREIAQTFMYHGVDIHSISGETNILRFTLDNNYPADLMDFYLKRKVDVKKIYRWTGNCLLHDFAQTSYSGGIKNLDNFMQKAKLLIEAIPDKINLLNHSSQTPADVAEQSLKDAKKNKLKAATLAFRALIALLEEFNGFTREKLQAQSEFEVKRFKNLDLCF